MKTKPLTPCKTPATLTIFTKWRIIKNVGIMSFGCLVLFTSFDGLVMLQSTMNNEKGIGVISQAVINMCFCVSSLIFPKYVIKKLGSKLTYVFAMLTYIPYIAWNFYPHWSLMIPTSIVIGFGAPLLWGSQDVYLNEVAVLYAEMSSAEQSEKDSFDKWQRRQSASNRLHPVSSSVNCQPIDYGSVVYYKKDKILFDKAHQSEKHDKYQDVTVETVPSQKSVPQSLNELHSSSEYQSYSQLKVSSCQIPSFSTTGDGLHQINSNIKSKVAMASNKKKAIESTTVPAYLDPNQTIDKENCPNKTDSVTQTRIEKDHRKNVLESTTARFFGVHGLMFISSQIWSNLMTYYVLHGDDDDNGMIHNCKCGADFCNVDSNSCLQENMHMPSHATRYLLMSVSMCLALASVLMIFLFLDPVKAEKKEDVSFSLDFVAATFNLAKRTELLLLMPASLYLGLVEAFFQGEFTKSFVGCAWGNTSQVSLVAICYGSASAIASLATGWSVKLAGRPAVFTVAAFLNAATCVLLLRWSPDPSQPALFFVAAGLLGCYDASMWSQLRALYGVLFKRDEEAAFATFHTWYSLGYCVSFASTNYFCTSLKIYVLLVMSTVGFAGYCIVERRHANNEIK